MELPDLILDFWFGSGADDALVAKDKSSLWWSKNSATDHEIRTHFTRHVEAAACGELDEWKQSPRKLLALIVLCDQFPRNIYRNSAQAFALDSFAQACCLAGLEQGMDRLLRPIERVFLYLPLEHAESIEYQERSVKLYSALVRQTPSNDAELFQGYLSFARRHHHIIERFGRFPHRNLILGRCSTADEIVFLQEPYSSF